MIRDSLNRKSRASKSGIDPYNGSRYKNCWCA